MESSKGALGAYLDQSGDSFDQAALLLAMLKSAASSNTQIGQAQIVVGLAPVTAMQFGLPALPATLLVDAGDTQAWANAGVMPYAWVQVKINGSWVVMDPGAKTYAVLPGSNLSGYLPQTTYSPNRTSIDTYLSSFAANIYAANKTDYDPIEGLIGGRRLQVNPFDANYNNYNPSNLAVASTVGGNGVVPSTTPSAYNTMPYSYRTLLQVALVPGTTGTAAGTVCLDQIYGRRTGIYYTMFAVDSVTVFTGNNATTDSVDTFSLVHQVWNASGLTNPWGQQTTETFNSNNGAAIQFAVGRVNGQRAQEAAKQAETIAAPGSGWTDFKFASMGASVLRQASGGTDMLDQLSGMYTLNHHTVQFNRYTGGGPVWQTGAVSYGAIDTPMTATSVDVVTSTPASGLQVTPNAVAYALSALQSAQENVAFSHANIPNAGSAASKLAGFSPVLLTDLPAGSDPSQNINLTDNYPASMIATLKSYTSAGYEILVPSSPSSWNGGKAMAFMAAKAGGTSAFVLQTPDGVFKGASSPSVMGGDGGTVGIGDLQPESGPRGRGLAIAPADGAVTFATPLLSIGSKGSPYSLGLSLGYSSNASSQLTFGTGAAPGWAHNYNINLQVASDPSALVGHILTGPAIPAVASAYFALQNANLIATSYAGGGNLPINAAYDLAATADWYIQRGTSNLVSINRGSSSEVFVLMPDNTYRTLSPSGETLANNGANFVWRGAHGDTETFPLAGGGVLHTDTANGVVTTFTYSVHGTKTLLDKVATLAHALTFTYQADPNASAFLLSSVAEETGRNVGFTYVTAQNNTNNMSVLYAANLVDSTTAAPRSLLFGYLSVTSGDYWPGNCGAIVLNKVTDSMTNQTTVTYDSRFNGAMLTNANNHSTNYLTAGGRAEIDDAMGNTGYAVTYPLVYGGFWNITDTYDALGNHTHDVRNTAGQLFSKTLPDTQAGYNYGYTYDGHGNLASTAIGPQSSGLMLLTQTNWDQTWNKPALTIDQMSNATHYYYDTLGNLKEIDPPSVSCNSALYTALCGSGAIVPKTLFTYWPSGQVKTVTKPDGSVSAFTYATTGNTGNLLQVVQDSGGLNLTSNLGYDTVGNVNSITTPNGNTTTATYDAARRLSTKTDPILQGYAQGFMTTYAYDPDGRRLNSQYFYTGDTIHYQITTQTYDAIGNLLTTTIPTTGTGSAHTSYTYDADERRSVTTDPAGNATTSTYDSNSRPYQVIDANTHVTQTSTYTNDGLLKQVLDGNNNPTVYTYDNYDRKYLTTYADGTTERVLLNNDGSVTQDMDRYGNTANYTLDALQRKTNESATPGTSGQPSYARSFTFDPASRIATAADAAGWFLYGYDTAGRANATYYTPSAGQPGPTGTVVAYQHDNDGNVSKITYPDGYAYTYAYDRIGELSSVAETPAGSSTATNLVTYSYNTLHDPIVFAFANGASTNFTGYDQYEGVTQMVQAYTGGTGNKLTETYTLDGNERRVNDSFSNNQYVWHPSASASVPYSPNALNQYSTVSGKTLTYNPNGALVSDPTSPLASATISATYGWDIFNRLTSATNSLHNASYTYDAQFNRYSKTVDGVTTVYVSSGNQVIAEYSNTSSASGTELRHYVYGVGNTPFLQEMFTSGAVTASYYSQVDTLGTTLAQSNATGATYKKYPTSPWGEVSATAGTPFRFAGMWFDPETGLYYDHARYYSPQQGRFISPDPIELEGGVNIYAYAGSDPVNGSDPSGLFCAAKGYTCPYGPYSVYYPSSGQLSAATNVAFWAGTAAGVRGSVASAIGLLGASAVFKFAEGVRSLDEVLGGFIPTGWVQYPGTAPIEIISAESFPVQSSKTVIQELLPSIPSISSGPFSGGSGGSGSGNSSGLAPGTRGTTANGFTLVVQPNHDIYVYAPSGGQWGASDGGAAASADPGAHDVYMTVSGPSDGFTMPVGPADPNFDMARAMDNK